ncbi:hypothetical protein TRIATDRAFT_293650 [Trichoderma atroviride IMI 206040]|uniref:Uncharacterized protein n=1 Tax=Hypocrea atroviridis (strain ATCC 20476 / IMI 206040) TaxID=452589 RepID=G9NY82_HYPAI|nr:uncharacterized protein TRIATDRAFT_293650 [Trichoderma atroviride IMI 206040]EHK44408.1 hypothetical protein TRIATDRAFT_293650 [Trichoderma atroviride IMI 206040]
MPILAIYWKILDWLCVGKFVYFLIGQPFQPSRTDEMLRLENRLCRAYRLIKARSLLQMTDNIYQKQSLNLPISVSSWQRPTAVAGPSPLQRLYLSWSDAKGVAFSFK